MKLRIILAASAAMGTAVPAQDEIPESVLALFEAAMATGDEEKVNTVIELAKTTNPDDIDELDAMLASFATEMEQLAAAEALAEEEAIRSAGVFENWSGQGELGCFNFTGNTENTGVTASLSLVREGINWRHKLSGRADYQETDGVATREQYAAAYEVNLKMTDRLFAYGLAQYERDPFQGFSARYAVSGGLGYDVLVDGPTLTVNAGPAWRRTELVDNGGATSDLAARAALDFDWDLSENITFTQDASAFIQSGSSTYTSATGLQAGISDALSVRLSYTVEVDTDPPPGSVQTDTLSRITILYDF